MGRGLGDLIASLIIGAIGYVVADTVTKEHTGNHIRPRAVPSGPGAGEGDNAAPIGIVPAENVGNQEGCPVDSR
jgi:hypothetical protein